MVRLSRLLRILNLIQTYPGLKAQELADYCDVSVRTIYRDLNVLNEAGISIISDEEYEGYRFLSDFKLHPINWTDEEYKAFTILPNLFEKGTSQPKQFYSAYEKVMAAYHSDQADRRKFKNHFSKVIRLINHESKESNFLQIITDAILSQRTIESIYVSFNSNTEKKRWIDPYFLIPRKSRLYIIGYCHESKELRTFRLNRFKQINLLEQTFEKDNVSLDQYFKHTWSIFKGNKQIDFKVKFKSNIARYIVEDEYNVEPKMKTQADGSLLFEVTLNDDKEFLKWLLQFGPDAEIIEPKIYRKQLKHLLNSWSDIYR